MPTRVLRDGILTSERINTLGWAEEVFYRRLMSVADDYGRYYAHPSLIRAACYPLRLDKVSDSDIGKWLTACVNAALVRVYPAKDGKRYLEIVDFGQRVQSKSKFPAPTVDHGESQESTALVGGEVGGEVGGDDSESAGDSATAMLAAYHRILPNCKRIHVLNPKRLKRFREAEKLAKRVCREQGWEYEPAVFWGGYFTVCAGDEWLRGDKSNPNNPAWKQSIDVLLAEDRFAGIMDDAITAIKAETAA